MIQGREDIRLALIEFFQRTSNKPIELARTIPFLMAKKLKLLEGRKSPAGYVSNCIRDDNRFEKVPVGQSGTRTAEWRLRIIAGYKVKNENAGDNGNYLRH